LAKLHPFWTTKNLTELRCTFLSSAAHLWATLHPNAFNWATLHPICAMLHHTS
jgi:hypothetical protein